MRAISTIVFMIVLIVLVAVCKAAKFPFQLRSQDCDFCTDFMLDDCICDDVEFCKSRSCYVPDKCANVQCDDQTETQTEEEMPSMVQETEIVPATAATEEDCDFCTDFMLEDCICEDVEFCKSRSCYVPDKCADVQCDYQTETQNEEEMPSMVQEPEIVPATAATLGNESEEECQYCVSMPLGCYCEDVDWCRGKQCTILARCDEECPLQE